MKPVLVERRTPPPIARRAHNRLGLVLDEAARVFAEKGFVAASIRQIVEPIGMLPGSLYYHFPTKDDLLVAVYREGVKRISAKVDAAVTTAHEPWARLQAAAVAHLGALLDRTYYSQVVIRIQPGDAPAVADQLVALRDSYEKRFVMLIAQLPLPKAVRRRDVRLFLIGALNWTPTWFQKDGNARPDQIAERFIGMLRYGLLQPEEERP